MSQSSKRLGAMLALSVCAAAQEPNAGDLKGLLHSERDIILHGYVAELSNLLQTRESMKTDVLTDGAFLFRRVPYGDYVLKITTYDGSPIVEQFVAVHQSPTVADVRLPNPFEPRPATGRVSLRELQHRPAAKAVKAALAGQRFSHEGQYERAAEESSKSGEALTGLRGGPIRISPSNTSASGSSRRRWRRFVAPWILGDPIPRTCAISRTCAQLLGNTTTEPRPRARRCGSIRALPRRISS